MTSKQGTFVGSGRLFLSAVATAATVRPQHPRGSTSVTVILGINGSGSRGSPRSVAAEIGAARRLAGGKSSAFLPERPPDRRDRTARKCPGCQTSWFFQPSPRLLAPKTSRGNNGGQLGPRCSWARLRYVPAREYEQESDAWRSQPNRCKRRSLRGAIF